MQRFTTACLTITSTLLAGGSAVAATVSLAPGDPMGASWVTTAAGTTGAGTQYLPSVPGAYGYTQGFGPGEGGTPAQGSGTEGFYVDYVFTIDAAVANSLTTSISLGDALGISGLSARLFSFDPLAPVPVTGTPSGAVYSAWTAPLAGGAGQQAVIDAVTLAPGTYVLQVRGSVTGTGGGAYSGVLNLTPVPLPAAGWLLVAGLLGVGAMARRRNNGPAAH